MKFTCSRDDFLEALLNVSRAASPKSSMAVLEGILLRATSRGLYICCYNLEMGIAKSIDADVEQEGAVVMSVKLCDIVRRLPGERVSIQCSEKLVVTISSDASEFELIGMSDFDFPELPVVDGEHNVAIEQSKLKSMIAQTAHAISTNQTRPLYTGALFQVYNDHMQIVTLDGFRVAVRREEIPQGGEFEFIVPGKTLSEINKILSDSEDIAEIGVGKNNILFVINGYSVISRLMIGTFINYSSAFPADGGIEIRVKTSDMLASMDRMSLVIDEKLKSPVRCCFGDGTIKFVCNTSAGRAEDEISCKGSCGGIEIGFNNKYVIDTFRAVDCDEVRIMVNGPKTAMKVLPPEGDHFLFLLMPVMLNA